MRMQIYLFSLTFTCLYIYLVDNFCRLYRNPYLYTIKPHEVMYGRLKKQEILKSEGYTQSK